jgi:hypothetical protein
VAWLLLAAFSQVYSKNQEEKTEQKYVKNVWSGQKRSNLKVVDKEDVVVKEISAI